MKTKEELRKEIVRYMAGIEKDSVVLGYMLLRYKIGVIEGKHQLPASIRKVIKEFLKVV